MAIVAVKATKIQSGSGSASVAVSATGGNALFVGGGIYRSGSWVVTRTGDTYTTDSAGVDSNDIGTGIASAPNVANGSVTCTITCTGATAISGWALEMSGLPASSIRDATSPARAEGASTTPTSNALTNATASAVYVCAFGHGCPDTTVTPGTGYTSVVGAVTMEEETGSTKMVGGLEYQIVSTTASRTGAWTSSAGAYAWSCVIAVYRAASFTQSLKVLQAVNRAATY